MWISSRRRSVWPRCWPRSFVRSCCLTGSRRPAHVAGQLAYRARGRPGRPTGGVGPARRSRRSAPAGSCPDHLRSGHAQWHRPFRRSPVRPVVRSAGVRWTAGYRFGRPRHAYIGIELGLGAAHVVAGGFDAPACGQHIGTTAQQVGGNGASDGQGVHVGQRAGLRHGVDLGLADECGQGVAHEHGLFVQGFTLLARFGQGAFGLTQFELRIEAGAHAVTDQAQHFIALLQGAVAAGHIAGQQHAGSGGLGFSGAGAAQGGVQRGAVLAEEVQFPARAELQGGGVVDIAGQRGGVDTIGGEALVRGVQAGTARARCRRAWACLRPGFFSRAWAISWLSWASSKAFHHWASIAGAVLRPSINTPTRMGDRRLLLMVLSLRLHGLDVVQHAFQHALEGFPFLTAEAGQGRVVHTAKRRGNLGGSLFAVGSEVEVDDASVCGRALALDQALVFQAVQHAGGGTGIELADARERCTRVGLAAGQGKQRHPLRMGQAAGLELGVDFLGNVGDDAAHQIAHAVFRPVIGGPIEVHRR
ncbi:unnamed protein product [Victoria cruziana]